MKSDNLYRWIRCIRLCQNWSARLISFARLMKQGGKLYYHLNICLNSTCVHDQLHIISSFLKAWSNLWGMKRDNIKSITYTCVDLMNLFILIFWRVYAPLCTWLRDIILTKDFTWMSDVITLNVFVMLKLGIHFTSPVNYIRPVHQKVEGIKIKIIYQ